MMGRSISPLLCVHGRRGVLLAPLARSCGNRVGVRGRTSRKRDGEQQPRRVQAEPLLAEGRFDGSTTQLKQTFLFHDAPSWAGGNAAVDLVQQRRASEAAEKAEKAAASSPSSAASQSGFARGAAKKRLTFYDMSEAGPREEIRLLVLSDVPLARKAEQQESFMATPSRRMARSSSVASVRPFESAAGTPRSIDSGDERPFEMPSSLLASQKRPPRAGAQRRVSMSMQADVHGSTMLVPAPPAFAAGVGRRRSLGGAIPGGARLMGRRSSFRAVNDTYTPLHVAAVDGDIEAVTTLVDSGFNIETKVKDGR
jgi:hypothetical protein